MNTVLRYRNTIAALIIVIIFFIVARGIHDHYAQKLAEVSAQEDTLDEGKLILDQWIEASQTKTQLQDKFFENDVLSFKQFVEERAQASSIRIDSSSFSQQDKDLYWVAAINFRFRCTYKQFVQFVKSCETKMVEVDQIQVATTEDMVSVSASIRSVVLK